WDASAWIRSRQHPGLHLACWTSLMESGSPRWSWGYSASPKFWRTSECWPGPKSLPERSRGFSPTVKIGDDLWARSRAARYWDFLSDFCRESEPSYRNF